MHMLKSKKRENNEYPCKPQFYIQKWGLKRSTANGHVSILYVMPICWNIFPCRLNEVTQLTADL